MARATMGYALVIASGLAWIAQFPMLVLLLLATMTGHATKDSARVIPDGLALIARLQLPLAAGLLASTVEVVLMDIVSALRDTLALPVPLHALTATLLVLQLTRQPPLSTTATPTRSFISVLWSLSPPK